MSFEPNSDLSIRARTISGCRRQLADVIQFLPILVASIIVGLALMLLNFWLANWNPSPLRGFIALFSFVCAPMTAILCWQRWRFRPDKADVILTIRRDALEILSIDDSRSTRIEWGRLNVASSRSMSARTIVLRVQSHSEASPTDRFAIDFALCADKPNAVHFAEQVRRFAESSGFS